MKDYGFVPNYEVMEESYVRDQIRNRGWSVSREVMDILKREFADGIENLKVRK